MEADRACEDLDAIFFDADGDKNVDLYVVSGGNEFGMGDPRYQDRLYIGDGKGGFQKSTGALGTETASGGCVVTTDIDKDGDLDLFVGNRLVPGLYPASPKSVILRNDTKDRKIVFTDITEQYSEALLKAGMVTAALWADINKDTWDDLVIVGEWMPVRVFQNDQGKAFTEITSRLGLENTNGWWSGIFAGDVDADGDIDLLAGNAGVNLQIEASPKEPVSLYAQDIDNDASVEPLLCYFIEGKSYPFPSRDELLEQVPPLKKRFTSYSLYADATINEIVSEEKLSASYHLMANTFKSSWLENDGAGKFSVKPLPPMAQVSCAQGFVQTDFDDDGADEILVAGNFYPYRVQLGRSDASMGVLLKFANGQVTEYKSDSPLPFTGDIRDLSLAKFKNSSTKIVVSRNDDHASVYGLVPRLRGRNDLDTR